MAIGCITHLGSFKNPTLKSSGLYPEEPRYSLVRQNNELSPRKKAGNCQSLIFLRWFFVCFFVGWFFDNLRARDGDLAN